MELNKMQEEAKKMKLADTVQGMISSDPFERLVAEYQQQVIRIEGLAGMLDKWDKGALPFTPDCDRSVYEKQLTSMQETKSVLEVRVDSMLKAKAAS